MREVSQKMKKIIFVFCALLTIGIVNAEDKIVPYNAIHPIPYPIVSTYNEPPLVLEMPKDPVYIPTVPGLIDKEIAVNFFGKKIPKYDGLVIKGTKIEGGKVIIPPGGFVFLLDTWRGILPMVGEMEFILGKDNIYYYVDYPKHVIVKKTDIELERGKSVLVGDNIFKFITATGHGRFRNPTVQLYTKHGVMWEFVGMSPGVFSVGAKPGDPGKDFHYGYPGNYKPVGDKEAALLDYNQMFATRGDISTKKITFSTIYSVDNQGWTLCKAPLAFKGSAKKGDKFEVKGYTIEVVDTNPDPKLQSATIRISKNGKVVAEKELVWAPDKDLYLSPYNVEWQDKVLLKQGDIIIHLLGSLFTPDAVDSEGKANLVIYQDCFVLEDGMPSPWDNRFLADQITCPQGHGFGIMFYNKDGVVLTKENNVFEGPNGYIKLVIDEVSGDTAKYHIESKTGGKSLIFEKTGNVDTLLGKGRAIKDIIYSLGTAVPRQLYERLETGAVEAAAPAKPPAEKKGICGPTALIAIATIPILYRIKHRRA
jgi:hypothetical protein